MKKDRSERKIQTQTQTQTQTERERERERETYIEGVVSSRGGCVEDRVFFPVLMLFFLCGECKAKALKL